MKKMKQYLIRIFTIIALFCITALASAQPPPPPGGGGGENTRGQANKLGGAAPIGSGSLILLALGMAYGGRKVYVMKIQHK